MSPGNLFWTATAAYILAWSIQVTYRVIAINRAERLFLPGPSAATPPSRPAKVISSALPIPLLFWIIELREESDNPSSVSVLVLACVGGVFAAYFLAFTAVLFAALVAPPGHVNAGHFFSITFRWQRWVVARASAYRLISVRTGVGTGLIRLHGRWARQFRARLRRTCARKWPNGYFDQTGRLYGGHWIALTSCGLSLLLYIALGFVESPNVPALSYVLQFQFFAVWVTAAASFFLDRFRIPVTVPLIAVCLVFAIPSFLPTAWTPPVWFPSSDHYYKIWRKPDGQVALASPVQVLDAFLSKTEGKVIVVATAGGGIQAAAWTAEVLTELQASVAPPPDKPRFADSIAVLSGVSGGAAGMMFFGTRYNLGSPFPADRPALQKIVGEAESPTLNEVAWGLTHADVARILFPFLRFGPWKLDDRGGALENAWRRNSGVASLSAWAKGPGGAQRPAFLFNSTIAETGEPFLFATSDLTYSPHALEKNGKYAHRKTFFSEYRGYDVEVVTAARLAASFPYVTPAARPLRERAEYHNVDGGYYDNYGLSSLMAWLAEALDKMPSGTRKPQILVLEIRSFPPAESTNPQWKTWFYQSYAPIDGLYNVRETGQSLRDDEELRAFEAAYANKAAFANACFQFLLNDAPLSWQLNRSQKNAVGSGWSNYSAEFVQRFLAGSLNEPGKTCQ